MKYLNTYESLRDKMTPVSDEQLRNKMGEERYTTYKKLLDLQETLNKRPFGYSNISKEYDKSPMFLNIQTELDNFNIKFTNGKYIFYSVFAMSDFKLDTKEKVISKMKQLTIDALDSYTEHRMEDIDKIYKDIKEMKEEMSYINKNY